MNISYLNEKIKLLLCKEIVDYTEDTEPIKIDIHTYNVNSILNKPENEKYLYSNRDILLLLYPFFIIAHFAQEKCKKNIYIFTISFEPKQRAIYKRLEIEFKIIWDYNEGIELIPHRINMEILNIPLREFEEPLKNFNLVIVSQKLKHIKNLLKLENLYKLREKDNNTCTYKNEECAISLKSKPQVLYCNCGQDIYQFVKYVFIL